MADDPQQLLAAGAPGWRIMEAVEQQRREAIRAAGARDRAATEWRATTHRPRYVLCPDPFDCCGTTGPLAIRCAVDGEEWPCTGKREHHTEAENGRTARWAAGRIERSYAYGY